MKMTYDKKSDSAYIYLNKNEKTKVLKTIEINDNINYNADLDENDNIIGIEILDFKKTYGYIPNSIDVDFLDQNDNLKVFTPDEVAKILKINSDTVRKYIREGKMPASKIGNTYRITSKNITDFLNQNLINV
jgi:excisionase family DNA binding protein